MPIKLIDKPTRKTCSQANGPGLELAAFFFPAVAVALANPGPAFPVNISAVGDAPTTPPADPTAVGPTFPEPAVCVTANSFVTTVALGICAPRLSNATTFDPELLKSVGASPMR